MTHSGGKIAAEGGKSVVRETKDKNSGQLLGRGTIVGTLNLILTSDV